MSFMFEVFLEVLKMDLCENEIAAVQRSVNFDIMRHRNERNLVEVEMRNRLSSLFVHHSMLHFVKNNKW